MNRRLKGIRSQSLALSVLLVFFHSSSCAGYGDVPPDVRGQISSIVAAVGSVWDDDELLLQFHKNVADRFKDTPDVEPFRRDEQWISAFSSRSLRYPGVFNARSTKAMNVRVGDIVRIRLGDYRKVDSYYRLNSVEEVLCRAADAGFEACSERTPLAWTVKSES